MSVVNFTYAAERIAWARALRLDALRRSILIAALSKLQQFKPNTVSNFKLPWKVREPSSARAWCPLHGGRWAKLIVRVGEDGHVSYECCQGCSHEEVSHFLNGRTQTTINSGDTIVPAASTQPSVIAGDVVYDARHLFRTRGDIGGVRILDSEDDPAA